jgi:hypothetical protein
MGHPSGIDDLPGYRTALQVSIYHDRENVKPDLEHFDSTYAP